MSIVCVCLLGAVTTCRAVPSFGLSSASRIDRRALVTRHNPTLAHIDPASPQMVGNGYLGFTADITGGAERRPPTAAVRPRYFAGAPR